LTTVLQVEGFVPDRIDPAETMAFFWGLKLKKKGPCVMAIVFKNVPQAQFENL
jgi:hypothetical protein